MFHQAKKESYAIDQLSSANMLLQMKAVFTGVAQLIMAFGVLDVDETRHV